MSSTVEDGAEDGVPTDSLGRAQESTESMEEAAGLVAGKEAAKAEAEEKKAKEMETQAEEEAAKQAAAAAAAEREESV